LIELKGLCIELGAFYLRDLTLNIQDGEYVMVLGPTGSGKTVLLETIAGLHPVKSGVIVLDGREVTKTEPEKRGIGIVYQDYLLFPHLSVIKNITFGLRQRGRSRKEAEAEAGWTIELLGLSSLLSRKISTLSGGEKQKVALARALAIKPKVLLLDEPLSALDPETRERVQRELREIWSKLNQTIIHVTHDFEEAVSLGERIAVLGNGCIMQVGTAQQIFCQPKSEFVARFAMTRNIFAGEVRDDGDEGAIIDIGGTLIQAVTILRGHRHASVRPEDILISTQPFVSSARNSFMGVITDVASKGSTFCLTINVPPDFVCLVTRRSFEEMELKKGGKVYVTFKASAVNVF
jgi:molybdopterin-binding protein